MLYQIGTIRNTAHNNENKKYENMLSLWIYSLYDNIQYYCINYTIKIYISRKCVQPTPFFI